MSMARKGDTIQCKRCGTDVVVAGPNTRYCAECRQIISREWPSAHDRQYYAQRRKIREAMAKKSPLSEDAKAAKEAGMTYGKWRAAQLTAVNNPPAAKNKRRKK